MKVELSDKTKTNIKAVTLTALVVLVVVFLITMLFKYPIDFMAYVVLITFFAFVGYFIFQTFISIRAAIVEYQEKKELEELRKARNQK